MEYEDTTDCAKPSLGYRVSHAAYGEARRREDSPLFEAWKPPPQTGGIALSGPVAAGRSRGGEGPGHICAHGSAGLRLGMLGGARVRVNIIGHARNNM